MLKYILGVVLGVMMFSCASRKVVVSETKAQVLIDSVFIEKKDSVAVEKKNIVIQEDINVIEVTPVNLTSPIIIGDVKYYNAKVKLYKNKKKTEQNIKTIVSKSVNKKITLQKKDKIKTYNKNIDKKSNYLYYLFGILFLLFILFIVGRYFIK